MKLPKNVYAKHSAYYLVRDGEWIRLTDRLVDVERALAALALPPESREEITDFARLMVARSRSNARNGRLLREHELTTDDVDRMLAECDFRCSVTRVPFSLRKIGPRQQRPYAPSIDRTDNAVGYVRGNCRMVCAAANIAMNTWGEGVLHHLIRHAKLSKVLDVQLDSGAK